MAISREKKEAIVARYTDLLQASSGFAIVQTQGLPVPRVQALRKVIRDAGGLYTVGKNTLLIKALEANDWVIPDELLTGPTGVVFGMENMPGVTKALLDFLEEEKILEENMQVTGGVLGGTSIFDAAGAEAVSNMPTLPELQSQIIGLLVAPQTQLVSVLHQANSGIVNVLQSADTQVLNVLQAWIQKQENEGAA
ncbi:MAG: 50S ribosomal protein L10 [Aggregatilineales bacterium]